MDPIDQRLSFLQNDLKEKSSIMEVLLESGLVLPVFGLIVGIFLQHSLAPTHPMWRISFLWILSAGLLLGGLYAQNHHLSAAAIVFVFLCFGALRTIQYQQSSPYDIANNIKEIGRPITVEGTIVTQPKALVSYSRSPQRKQLPQATTFNLLAHQARSTQGWGKATGTLRIQVVGPLDDCFPGDTVRVYGLSKPIPPATNPGQFNYALYLARQNIHVMVLAKDPNCVRRLSPAKRFSWSRMRAQFQQAAAEALLKQLPENSPQTGLLLALILGDRSRIPPSLQEAFAKTGLLHMISLSGLHVGILMGLVWQLGRLLGLLKPGRAFLCAVIMFLFVLMIPTRGPSLRAAIIGWSFCAAYLFRRRPSPWHSLALSAGILLVARPTQLFEAGWQLSFACVAGILLLAKPLGETLCGLAGDRLTTGPKNLAPLRGLLKAAINLLSVGFCACLAGAGVILAHFYTITPLSFLWTLLAFPLVALILPLGYVKILLGFIPGLSVVLAKGLLCSAFLLISMVQQLARIPYNTFVVGHVPWFHIAGYYLILLVALLKWKKSYPRLRIRSLLLLALGLGLYCLLPNLRSHQGLTLTCLDVGHGQAVVLRIANRTWLFDAGSLYKESVGCSIINPFLDYSGISTLEAAVLSHHDVDHINGLPDVANHCRVHVILANKPFQKRLSPESPLAPLLNRKKRQIDDLTPATLKLPTESKVLWPLDPNHACPGLCDNDTSAVIQITYAGKQILLCGDIEAAAQEQLLKAYPNLHADILLVPHHGSLRTLLPPFLEDLAPETALCSCSQSQVEQNRVVTDLPHSKVFLTARDGAIQVHITEEGQVAISTWFCCP